MKTKNLLFFADRLPPLIGGMEIHARYFVEHFKDHPRIPLSGVITKTHTGNDVLITNHEIRQINILELPDLFDPDFVFFNSGRWIEELEQLRQLFSKSTFIYRTGGNEILKAPLITQHIPNHSLRQRLWAKTINNTIDLLITNSFYTEERLRHLGITCPFKRIVGGVNITALKESTDKVNITPTIFCAARFVPYKNHVLLLKVIKALVSRGHQLCVRLAGEGPLLGECKEFVSTSQLSSAVEFLGVIDNKSVFQEIANADLYMQLSSDYLTNVPGGSYIHSEGMGRSILEALSVGTFVVAGKGGALSEIITPERGLLIELDCCDTIVNQLEQLIKLRPPKQPMLDLYCWNNVFKSYEEVM